MKKVNIYLRLIIVSVICAVTHTLSAQILIDDFQDGNITSNPIWEGNTENFTVNSSGELQLDASTAGMSYLSTSVGQSAPAETEWRFYIKQSFSGSDNNTSRLYLMSSLPTIDYTGTGGASVQGYFLQFGESGSDDALRLVRNDLDGTTIDIAEGTAGFVSSSFEITVKVVRTTLGDWEIWADANAGEEFSLQALGTDATYSFVNHFGWVCKYTSSNADNFFLDNVYIGEPLVDNDPPVLTQLIVGSASELTVEFNEPLNGVSAETLSNYSVSSGIGNPTAAIFSTPNLVTLTFGTSFASEEELVLTVTGVTDVTGNEITSAEEQFTYFEISEPQLGDIIINEIFADPTPAIGLPDTEWLELHNTSENAFDISLLELYNTTTLNPIESYVLPSGGYVIISNESGTSALQTFGETASASSFSALTNSGDSLTLLYNGTVIDRVVYEDDWYSDIVKEDGGWSLERINPNALCSGSQNWIASNSVLGGTPGIQNSVNDETPDTEEKKITSASLINDT
ncbi:MAG: lamin tail domain-containing protein [Flavobacteriales bacterium]